MKTIFALTSLLGKLSLLKKDTLRFVVSIDLLLNAVFLPILIYLKTVLFPSILRKHVVLVEEDLPGSLVDYVHASIILSLLPVVNLSLKMLLRLAPLSRNFFTVYLYCDKKILPERWVRRNTPHEHKTYLSVQDLVYKSWFKHFGAGIKVNTDADLKYSSSKIVNFITREGCSR
ncbi:MAG: hypothetical protein ACP5IE_03845 [Infirmifilum sp.]